MLWSIKAPDFGKLPPLKPSVAGKANQLMKLLLSERVHGLVWYMYLALEGGIAHPYFGAYVYELYIQYAYVGVYIYIYIHTCTYVRGVHVYVYIDICVCKCIYMQLHADTWILWVQQI